jgi:hypothetical protein
VPADEVDVFGERGRRAPDVFALAAERLEVVVHERGRGGN